MDYKNIKHLFKVRKTVLEMIEDRHYNIPKDIKDLQFENFKLLYKTKELNISFKDNNKNVYIHFNINSSKNLGKNDLKTIVKNIQEETQDPNVLIILILKKKKNSAVKKELLNEEYNNTELFTSKELSFNISKHVLVPKHIKLSKEEGQKILENFNVTKKQMPKILATDPMARYLGLKLGDICKIIRNSSQIGNSNYYRIVVNEV